MNRSPVSQACLGAALGSLLVLGACSSVSDALSTDKVDYRSGATQQATNLDVPPDLTQLSNDSHYQGVPPSGTVSASTFPGAAAAQSAAQSAAQASAPEAENVLAPVQTTIPGVSPSSIGGVQLVRSGTMRWLHTNESPDAVWPQIRTFWQQNGFSLDIDQPQTGVMQTNWLENRAKLPEDVIRRTLGKLFDNLYDTGERDMYRTRVERGENGGTDIYISQHGMQEVVEQGREGHSTWELRPNDPLLEADMLSRMMVALGATKEAAQQAKTQAAQPKESGPLKAVLVPAGSETRVQINDGIDVAWRRVGLALDRSSFTVEDRDRVQNTYFVRYVDPVLAEKSGPNFLARLFGAKDNTAQSLGRYRLVLSGNDTSAQVAVLNNQGEPDASANARKIAQILIDDLNQ